VIIAWISVVMDCPTVSLTEIQAMIKKEYMFILMQVVVLTQVSNGKMT
jgi:hypothetical protein